MNRILLGVGLMVSLTVGCQTARPPATSAPAPAPARSADSGPVTMEQLAAEMRAARAEQQQLDADLNKMREDLYRTALALKQIRDRLEGWATRSTQNVARLVVLEDQIRGAQAQANNAAAAEASALRESLRREREHQERLRAIIAEREKEVRDVRAAMRAQEESLRRAPAAAEPISIPAASRAPNPPPAPAPAAVAPPQPAAGTVYRMVADAQRALKGGDIARAQQLFRAAREQEPTLASATLGLAAIAYQTDDLKEARRLVDEVLSADARNAQALGLRGLIRWREGAVREGIRDCERAVELDPNDPLLRKFYGITLNSRGRTNDAIREMRKAVELDPTDAEAKLNLAILLATGARPDIEAARRHYQDALSAGAAPDPALERLLEAPRAP